VQCFVKFWIEIKVPSVERICRQVFSPINGKHENDKNIVLNQINQTVSLFAQFDLVTAMQVTVQGTWGCSRRFLSALAEVPLCCRQESAIP
jgi:hypothetical protein